ncbi:MAG: SDR family oxidoreductase [Acidobacteriota bacterium]
MLRYRDILRVMTEELGLRRRWIIPVPILTPRLSSYWIHLITPLSHHIAKPLAEGLKNPVVCREDRITKLIPQDLLNVRQSIHAALHQIAQHDVETVWSMAGTMPGDPDWAGGTVFRDARQVNVDAPDWAVFRAVCRIGGGHGWYATNWLWKIRGWIDILAGGPGLRRGRRHADAVAYGEAIDFWRVVGFDRDKRLSLRAEMKLPGDALLEFRIEPLDDLRCTLQQIAQFKPRGLFGLLYWYGVLPFHSIVFSGILQGIARDAAQIYARRPLGSDSHH